jgi:hypothetical protein
MPARVEEPNQASARSVPVDPRQIRTFESVAMDAGPRSIGKCVGPAVLTGNNMFALESNSDTPGGQSAVLASLAGPFADCRDSCFSHYRSWMRKLF